MPVRIYDISKQLGLENKDVLTKAKELGITAAKVPSSSLDKITAEYLINELSGGKPPVPATPAPAPEPEKIILVTAPPPPLPPVVEPAPEPTPESAPVVAETKVAPVAEAHPNGEAAKVAPAPPVAPVAPPPPPPPAPPSGPQLGDK